MKPKGLGSRGIAGRPRRTPLRVERLEDRCLLTATLAEPLTIDLASLAVDTSSYDDSRILVQFRDQAAGAPLESLLQAGSKLEKAVPLVPGLHQVRVDAEADFEAVLDAYRHSPNVLYAEPDFRVSLNLTPDDTSYDSLWGLHNTGQSGGTVDADIDAPEAWQITTGNRQTVVAVIDTGVDYTHPDLAANIWTNTDEVPGNGRDDDGNGYVDDVHGYDFVNRDGDPMDDHYHGTHVAGTIGALGNNGSGTSGVTWNVQIMALKFLDADGGGYLSNAIAAINYAVANGASVSNNSWSGGGYSSALRNAIQNAAAAGHIVVAAAGNSSSNIDTQPAYPASYDNANLLSVAASDRNDRLASFSNYGRQSVDLAAPGRSIRSTFPTTQTDAIRRIGYPTHYATLSGTSMAAPHVTGVVALVQGLHPNWTFQQVIDQVLSSTDDVPALGHSSVTEGRLNAAAAVSGDGGDASDPGLVDGKLEHDLVTEARDLPLPIRDRRVTVSSLVIEKDMAIADVNVRLDISHTYDSDLAIYLVSPRGTRVSLARHRGRWGNHFQDTLLDDQATTPIGEAAAPFAGTFRPDSPLSTLVGQNARGTWQLRVEDWFRQDQGTLNAWSLVIQPQAGSTSSSSMSSNGLSAFDASFAWGLAVGNSWDIDDFEAAAAEEPIFSDSDTRSPSNIHLESVAAETLVFETSRRSFAAVDRVFANAGQLQLVLGDAHDIFSSLGSPPTAVGGLVRALFRR